MTSETEAAERPIAKCGCSTRPSAMPTLPVCLWRNKFDRKGRRRVLLGPRAFLWVGCHRCRRAARSRRPVESDHLSQGSKRGVSHFGCLRRPVRTQARRRGAATVRAFRIASYRRGRWQLGHCRLPGGLLWYHASGRCLLGNCLLCADGGRRRSRMVRGWRRRPPGTASGGFRVFVGGLHSRMGTVWGSGDEGQVYPRAATILLIFGAVPVFGSLLVVGFPISILFSAAIVWLGFALLTGWAESAEQPSRVR